MNENQDYLSLYDYLKVPAGKKLGGLVLKFAKYKGIKPQWRYISNPTYTGYVATYPEPFLASYFNLSRTFQNIKQYFDL